MDRFHRGNKEIIPVIPMGAVILIISIPAHRLKILKIRGGHNGMLEDQPN